MSEKVQTKESVLQTFIKKGAKYSPSNPSGWQQNEAKTRRQSGKAYLSKATGRQMPAKKFIYTKKCCQQECFTQFSKDEQSLLFDKFYNGQSKECQDTFLAGCLDLKLDEGKRKTVNPKVGRNNSWSYRFKNNDGNNVSVCRSLLMNMLQISEKRLRVIQKKVMGGETFGERRGCHDNRPHKLEDNVWELCLEHLKSIPSRPGHYTTPKTNKMYFVNPNLTIKSISKEFQTFFEEKTGNPLKMNYKTYFKFFRGTNYDFSLPKTDVCDFCSECQIKLSKNPNDECRVSYDIHKRKASRFFELKRKYIEESKNSQSTMVLEFDYAQNLPLPKLPTNKQFYKRLLWLYIFNIHCHNDDTSVMYTFLESESKKGANTVSSFLFDFLSKKAEEYRNLKKVILLSDAAGGQNKNAILMRFCSFMAKSLDIDIIQMYPVRGHSFGQCDRNFGVLRNSLKRKQEVETPDVYLKEIQQCRKNPSPFQLVNDCSIIYDFGNALSPYFLKSPVNKQVKFKIQQFTVLKYTPTGCVQASRSYTEIFTPFTFRTGFTDELDIERAPRTKLKKAKINDIKDLYPFIKEESRLFYNTFFENQPM